MRQVALALLLSAVVTRAADKPVDPLKDAPQEYRDAIIASMRAFTARDFDKARETVQKADAAYQKTTISLNILGAVEIEQKRYDEGRKLCLEALQKDPKFFPALFNLAEIPFTQGKYAEARAQYEALQRANPKEDLVRFRIYLTYLLEKNDAEAKAQLDAIPLVNDTPISFYAHAAWEFAHENENGGKEWLASAFRAFEPVKQVNFIEIFYDLGWLKRDQAAETAAKEEAGK